MVCIIFIPFLPVCMLQPSSQTLQFLSSELCNKLNAIARPSPSSLLTSPLSLAPLGVSCLDSWVGDCPNLLLFPPSHGSSSSAVGGSAAAPMDRGESLALWHETPRTPLPSNPPPAPPPPSPTATPPGHGRQHGSTRALSGTALFRSALICRADWVESSQAKR